MNEAADEPEKVKDTNAFSPQLTAMLGFSVAVIIMNLHTAQPIVGLVASTLSIPASLAGFVAMAPLAGYALGLIFLVPLSDLVENRLLVLSMLAVAIVAAVTASVAFIPTLFLGSLLVLGGASSCIQVLVPVAVSMAPPSERGSAVGNVMAGLMIGVLLARPVASFITDAIGWRYVYLTGAFAMALTAVLLRLRLPTVHPQATSTSYPALIGSLWRILREEKILQRRAISAALMMASFSMFWSSIALLLGSVPFSFSQKDIAIFALVGAGGVLATPVAGRFGDRGLTRVGTIAAHIVAFLSMMCAAWAGTTTAIPPTMIVILLGASAVFLDIGLTADHTLGRREINMVRPEARGRMNGLFVGLFFIGGAIGAALSGLTWSLGGWFLTCMTSGVFTSIALFSVLVWKQPKEPIP